MYTREPDSMLDDIDLFIWQNIQIIICSGKLYKFCHETRQLFSACHFFLNNFLGHQHPTVWRLLSLLKKTDVLNIIAKAEQGEPLQKRVRKETKQLNSESKTYVNTTTIKESTNFFGQQVTTFSIEQE